MMTQRQTPLRAALAAALTLVLLAGCGGERLPEPSPTPKIGRASCRGRV